MIHSHSPLFALIKSLFFYSGIFHTERTKFYKIYSYLSQIPVIVYIVSLALYAKHVSISESDMSETAFYLGTFITSWVTVSKFVLGKTKKVQNMLRVIFQNEQDICSSANGRIKAVHLENTNKIMPLLIFYKWEMIVTVTACFCMSLIYIIKDMISPKCVGEAIAECQKPLPITFYVPFNTNNFYILANAYQMMIVFCISFLVFSSDIFLLTPILYILLKLKILQHVLENFVKYSSEGKTTSKGEMYSMIIRCIREHQQIISHLQELNGILKNLFLVDFFLHSLQIALYLFVLIASDTLVTLYNMFGLGCALYTFCQLLLIYWHAHILTEESLNVCSAIMKSDWYLADIKTRKCLIMMIMRAQRPLKFTVGPVYDVNLNVFLKIVKTIYSYLTLFSKRKY